MIGILGGMGPLATADFFRKLIDATPADGDADHVPVLIQSVPQIPSRPAAILEGATSPLPELLRQRDRLLAAGAVALAMPCNTAHYWHAQLAADCPVPFLHIADAVRDELARLQVGGRDVGIIATRATLVGDVFSPVFRTLGCRMTIPTTAEYEGRVAPGIAAVKRNATRDAGALFEPVVAAMLERGAAAVILACTEVPIALDETGSPLRERCIDSTGALARACVRWWREHGSAPR
jgi:aspartate racemase